MLNSDALHLVTCFQSSLEDGSYSNSTVKLLEITSNLVDIFRSKTPIKSVDDERLTFVDNDLKFPKWFSGGISPWNPLSPSSADQDVA